MNDVLILGSLVLFLGVALSSPLIQRSGVVHLLLTLAILFQLVVSVSLLPADAFYIALGGYQNVLGIELLVDSFALLFVAMISILGGLIHLFSYAYLKKAIAPAHIPSYYGLVALLFFAMSALLYTNDLFNTYVLIEIMSIATTGLVSIARKNSSYMAAFRYLLLNELASVAFLLGTALLYMVTGALNMTVIANALPEAYALYPINVALAFGFMGIALAIKIAVFPFHLWLPDAYTHAVASSSAFLSGLVSKVYMLVVLKIVLRTFGDTVFISLGASRTVMAVATISILMGSFFALGQKNFKRLLAYSSVSQVGILLLALSLLSNGALFALFFYMLSHATLKATLFLVAGAIEYDQRVRFNASFQGLGYVMPVTMSVFAVAVFGMIGIPGTSGFIAKFQLALAFNEASQALLIGLLILSSILSAIYLFPLLISAFVKKVDDIHLRLEPVPFSMLASLLGLLGLILTLGFAPGWVNASIEAAVLAIGF